MAMDMYTLYGETVASFLLHGVLAFLMGVLVTQFGIGGIAFYVVFALLLFIGSALINGGLLTILHQLTCSGVKNVSGILKGAGISGLLTAGIGLLPFAIPPLRLLISQMFISHKHLGTEKLIEAETVLTDAAKKIHSLSSSSSSSSISAEFLTPEKYEVQTLREAQIAVGYMAAFAGAYGMAIGAHWTSQCNS